MLCYMWFRYCTDMSLLQRLYEDTRVMVILRSSHASQVRAQGLAQLNL